MMYDYLDEDYEVDVEPMQVMDCPQCGKVATATGTCGYCGSSCHE